MSQQSNQLTYEGILELFRQTSEQMKESDRKFQETVAEMREMSRETDRKMKEMSQETSRKMKETDRKISALGSRIGEIIENMVKGKIVQKFQTFGYVVTKYSRNVSFEYKKLGIRGEVDLFLENGDVAILIEVKTTLETADVRDHIARLEKYRRYTNAANGDQRRFIGAVAGAVVVNEAAEFAHQNGLYVIVQSGEAVEIIPPPDDFMAKEW
ncbi:MAG: DUF3782 domain-containing protein [Planctomycetaceae bacterium]|nr:DUF3782 domain-containing protein [Planctomycetaceae bacterium]